MVIKPVNGLYAEYYDNGQKEEHAKLFRYSGVVLRVTL